MNKNLRRSAVATFFQLGVQEMVIGGIIIAAVALDRWHHRKAV